MNYVIIKRNKDNWYRPEIYNGEIYADFEYDEVTMDCKHLNEQFGEDFEYFVAEFQYNKEDIV